MIKSFYLRIFYLGLPGLYMAMWLSRFSLSMVNAMPYYYGMIMTAISMFCGMLIGTMSCKPFHKFFSRNNLLFFLASCIFLSSGHIYGWMDAGINAHFEILYYFAGLSLIGFIFSICMQHDVPSERNMILWSFVIGGVLSYFIGVKYFEQSHLDIYLGIPVFIIMLLNQLFIMRCRSVSKILSAILLTLINIVLCIIIHIKTENNFDSLSNIGYTKLKIDNGIINIIDNKQRKITDIKSSSLKNLPDLAVYQLQTNKSSNRVLYVGYPGSLTPVFLYRSPFVEKLDFYFWDITVPKGFPKQNIFQHHFYISQWDFFKKFDSPKYDLIIIESIPEESQSSQRIFLHYAKKLLKTPHGVVVYPESIARKYDGQYIKVSSESALVMLMGSESTENTAAIEERYEKFLKEKSNIHESYQISRSLPDKMITTFDSSNSTAPHRDIEIFTIISPAFFKFLLWAGLGIYLILRLFKCRYKNNQNSFFAFEAGFTFSIIIFSSLMLLSELRLVYPYFTPALFGISVMVMLPASRKKTAFIMHTALLLLLTYYLSVDFVRAFSPVYVVPVLLPLSFIAIANTLKSCKIKQYNCVSNSQNIMFFIGSILTLLLLICAKNNDLYPTLIYIAIISRLLFYFKI